MIQVYLADDEKWVLLGLQKLIQKSGLPFQVVGEADNGLLALEEIRMLRPQVLFTDIRMPKMTGIDLLCKIREEKLDVQTILISGYAEFKYAQAALRNGALDYILKPIQEKELIQILEKLAAVLLPEQNFFGGEDLCLQKGAVDEIVWEIQAHYTQDISLQGFAEKYNISNGHLSYLLKQEFGMSFTKYVTLKRMELAKELLKDRTLSIDQVAQKVGFHDYFYFTKVFKETQGISPSKFRKGL